MTNEALIELQTKIAYQEAAVEALQLTVYDQQKLIEKLSASVERLTKQIAAAADGGLNIGPANERPPHY